MMIPYGYKQTEVGVIPEDWSVSALEKLYNITSSKRVFQSQWRKSGVPFYRAREIAVMSEGKIAPEDLYIDESLYNQYIHQYGSINKNDILITGVGTLGKVYVVKENDRFYFKDGNIIWLQAKHDFSSIYLKYQYDMPALINQVFGNAGGSTVATYTITNAKTTKVPVPPLPEQQRIAEALSDVDGMISSLEKLIAKYKSIKTACLQQMFPQNGETVPRMRLPGFTGAWEQRKVQDVADRFDNLRIPVAANLRVHGTTPYYGANGIQDYVEGFTHDGEFVLVAEDGANDLKNYPVKCVNGRIWVNNHAHVLQGKAGIADNSFLAFAISQSDIESLLVGGGRAKLNAETLMSIEFRLPCLQEQYRIGEYLTQLDHLITLHQRKLEKIQKIKQGMMQQLLTGKIRLV